MEKFDVIIPAAGSGTRMGSSIPKLVMEVGGKAIIRRTVEAFLDNFDNCRITVVTSEDAVKEALAGLPVRFATGGSSRAESVYNGLMSLAELDIEPTGKVLVHDGARCLIGKDTISKVLAALDRYDAATCGVPEKNTFKKVIRRGEDIIVEKTPARTDYYEVQTPQGFRYDSMKKCFDPALIGDAVTDDVMFAELAGIEVAITEGSYSNIKITTPEDISFAEGLLAGI
jgi:2-C-methyl-D-erythritol 4-phosphate cytidylyltransferase